MKDNIDSKKIGNRKFIIELRYNPVVGTEGSGTFVSFLMGGADMEKGSPLRA